MRQLITIFLAAMTFSFSALANDFAVVLGMRSNSWDYFPTTSGVSGSGSTGYQAGVLGFIDVAQALSVRTGFIYTQRIFSITDSTSATNYNYSYFDVPITLMYKFSEFGGIFGGAVLALNSGKSCSGIANCSTDGVKSSLTGFQFGASFKFAPQMGAELYYESISGDIQASGGVGGKDAKSVGANFLITFE